MTYYSPRAKHTWTLHIIYYKVSNPLYDLVIWCDQLLLVPTEVYISIRPSYESGTNQVCAISIVLKVSDSQKHCVSYMMYKSFISLPKTDCRLWPIKPRLPLWTQYIAYFPSRHHWHHCKDADGIISLDLSICPISKTNMLLILQCSSGLCCSWLCHNVENRQVGACIPLAHKKSRASSGYTITSYGKDLKRHPQSSMLGVYYS